MKLANRGDVRQSAYSGEKVRVYTLGRDPTYENILQVMQEEKVAVSFTEWRPSSR